MVSQTCECFRSEDLWKCWSPESRYQRETLNLWTVTKGRIDAVIIDKAIQLFEFKFNGDKNKALNQIKEMKYFEKYQGPEVGGLRAEDREQKTEGGLQTRRFIFSV